MIMSVHMGVFVCIHAHVFGGERGVNKRSFVQKLRGQRVPFTSMN